MNNSYEFVFRANDENKSVNSKNINITAFEEQLSLHYSQI